MINICGLMKGLDCSERDGDLCRSSRSCKWKNQTNAHKARKTWVGFKPKKEATKKERLEKARKKYKGEQEQ